MRWSASSTRPASPPSRPTGRLAGSPAPRLRMRTTATSTTPSIGRTTCRSASTRRCAAATCAHPRAPERVAVPACMHTFLLLEEAAQKAVRLLLKEAGSSFWPRCRPKSPFLSSSPLMRTQVHPPAGRLLLPRREQVWHGVCTTRTNSRYPPWIPPLYRPCVCTHLSTALAVGTTRTSTRCRAGRTCTCRAPACSTTRAARPSRR